MQKQIIGYTTGVFDLFHVGHLHILQKAKEHCDYLIAGVSSDELVMEYKNKLPIIPFKDRIKIVSSLACVDEVVMQIDRDKMKQYKKIKFDILFVGDDWKSSEAFNKLEKELKAVNSKVKYFKYTTNISSTKFTNLLQDIYDGENSIN
jgi:glycerol-3-phosphate cytidylyltransferase